MEKTATTRRHGSSTGKVRTRDGVTLLEPATKPNHFTNAEIRETIRVVRDARVGQFREKRD